MNIKVKNCRENCSGCGTCYSVCPKKAISMSEDKHGFMYPQVNDSECVDCGLCYKKCPINDEIIHKSITAFYGWNNDESIRMKSSSGGLFSALADYILGLDGIVFGAVFNPETKRVEYKGTDEVELDSIRRSKYTECYTDGIFQKINDLLVQGKSVLFCGTPCHVAGLEKYLGRKYDTLITCDFVCGGAASPRFFRQHLHEMEKKYNSKVSEINFRDKKMGWKRMLFSVKFNNGKRKSTLSYFEPYFSGFIEGIIKRRNCFSCKYSANHYSDITIADYWGYLKAGVPYDKRGISMAIANTEKGLKVLRSISKNVTLTEMKLDRTKYTVQTRAFNQTKYDRRNAFFELADSIGYEKAAKATYFKNPLKDLLFLYVKR